MLNWHWDIIGTLGTLFLAIGGVIWKRLTLIQTIQQTELNDKLDKIIRESKEDRDFTYKLWDRLEEHITYHLANKL